MNADPEMLVPEVRNAGAVFCGPYAPAVIGDYVAGVNHVLPTGGTARFASTLRVSNFQKRVHVVSLDREALLQVGPYVTVLAASEGSTPTRSRSASAKTAHEHRHEHRGPNPRDDLRALEGYHSAQVEVAVRLNTNESPYPPPAEFMADWLAALADAPFNRYPDREAAELRAALAQHLGQPAARIFPANGSNEVLQTILLTYGGHGRRALSSNPPTRCTRISRASPRPRWSRVNATTPMAIDLDSAAELIERHRPAIVFVCSPNNPTGTVEPREVVTRLLDLVAANGGLLVVDEAYGEFAAWSRSSW